MKSFIKVAIIVLLATFTKADNCQYAPGNWIGDGSASIAGCSCSLNNIQWVVEDFSGDGTTLAITK